MDTVQESSAKPRKAFIITSGLGLLLAAMKMNPDEQSFYDRQLQCITELSMVGDPIRNPAAENHLTYLTRCQNQGLLRKVDLLFFSLIWEADYNNECNIYPAQCKYLQPKYFTFYQRIVDVGLFGFWINLKLKMRDFDVNPEEWNEQT
ncbi:mitochondrial import inner membrane translocase subunit Tim29 isoform X2 [Parasteatoda tepidariorum]